ncbi:MAG: ATPase domain-containing protein [Pyrinomonadaceae bacterium]
MRPPVTQVAGQVSRLRRVDSYAEERSRSTAKEPGGGRGGFQLRQVKPVAYGAIESQDEARTSSGIPEFDRVLGGGIVPGSLILIGGEPGIGKCLAASTRLIDPISGTYSSILEWINNKRPVVSLDEHSHRLSPQSTSAFHDQGVHAIVEVKTKLGRTLRCAQAIRY